MDATSRDLLVEIGTEELPPTILFRLSRAFAEGFTAQLAEQRISVGSIQSFVTPRRLALLASGVAVRQPDEEAVRRGPAISAAFDSDGRPTKAAEGFARSCGVAVYDLAREHSDKGEWLSYRHLSEGEATAALLPGMIERALGTLPIPKRMRWGESEAEFVRPVHWVCLVFGDSAVEGTVLGVPASKTTFGHRFHHPQGITVDIAGDYVDLLRNVGRVEPSFERRREMIVQQIAAIIDSREARVDIDSALLDEVTALVEWPTALVGTFDADFLAVPPEVLIETMQVNQKYFPVRSREGGLLPQFITVSNIDSKDPEQIVSGNERVIRPRFADAKFFWEQDLKQPLSARFARLSSMVFQEKLGTYAAKCERVARLGRSLAADLGEREELVERAARLSKCDLVTSMVYEFPGLQGIMGRYYAEAGGEDPSVCAAMEDQYLPRFAGDRLPGGACGRILALSDRLDTLVGIFAVGQRPTGTKDPFGLRRASIAVLRILIETPLELDLAQLLGRARDGFGEGLIGAETVDDVLSYTLDRLDGYYQDQGVPSDVVEAALATGDTTLSRLHRRILAVNGFRELPESVSLAAANKRIRNILLKSGTEDLRGYGPNEALFADAAERDLWRHMAVLQERLAPMIQGQDFAGVLATLAGLRDQVDAFFDQVLVMADDVDVRRNRLMLLYRLHGLFANVADISRLQAGVGTARD